MLLRAGASTNDADSKGVGASGVTYRSHMYHMCWELVFTFV